MRREDIIKLVTGKFEDWGVPSHMSAVRKVPCYVRVHLLTGDIMRIVELRSGITMPELEHKLNLLEGQWLDAKQAGKQVTLEEAIDAAKGQEAMPQDGGHRQT